MNRPDRFQLSVDDYIAYRRDGYIIIRNLVSQEEIAEIWQHTVDLMSGITVIEGVEPPPGDASEEERAQHFLRVHMLHRKHELHERYLLHPRICDVLETLVGPDLLALQTMLFLKPSGREGQGYHQDSYYIPTYPDTLLGSWLAIDRADEDNGCVLVTPGSHHEPIYPDAGRLSQNHVIGSMHDLATIEGASSSVPEKNGLTPVAAKYESKEVPAVMDPGDVMFFHGHVLHRSLSNTTTDRSRRAFVSHYCNARSWVPWNHGMPFDGPSGNHLHILARGSTHIPYALPKFGTPCDALDPGSAQTGVQPWTGDIVEMEAKQVAKGIVVARD